MNRRAKSKYARALRLVAAISSGAACSSRATVTLARMAARIERKSGRPASPSRSSVRLVSAVEDDVGRRFETALDQIHEQEGEIIEYVAGRDQRAELDGIECDRPAAEKHDVTEMKVAMETPNEPPISALDDERTDARVSGATLRGE